MPRKLRRAYSTKDTYHELFLGCKAKSASAQKALFEKSSGILFPVGLRYFGNKNDASEALQITMIKVFEAIKTADMPNDFKSWIARIMINNCIDLIRKQRKLIFVKSEMDVREIPIEETALSDMSAKEILVLVSKLEFSQRTVFSMAVVDGFKHKEIAEYLNITTGTSRWYLHQAKANLRDMIKINTHHEAI